MGATGDFERGGSLKVLTTHLTPGYYWKNGMPYSGNAALTEYFRVMELPDRSQWIRFTQIVDDPDDPEDPSEIVVLLRAPPFSPLWPT